MQFLLGSLWKKLLAAVLVALVLYALAGFFIAPRWLVQKLENHVGENTGRALSVDTASLNPFTLELRLLGLALAASDAAEPASADRIVATIHPAGLLARRWVFRQAAIEGAAAHLPLAFEDTALSAHIDASLASAWNALALTSGLEIRRLTLSGGELLITAAAAGPLVELADIELQIDALNQVAGARSPFSLTASVDGSGDLAAKGWLAPDLAELGADLSVSGIRAGTVDAWFDPGPGFTLTGASMSAEAALQGGRDRSRLEADIKVLDLEIISVSSGRPAFSAARLEGAGIVIGSELQKATVQAVSIGSPRLVFSRDPDGKTMAPTWLVAPVDSRLGASGSKATPAIDAIEVFDGRVDFTDYGFPQPLSLGADRVAGTLTRRNSPAGESVSALSLEARIGEAGTGRLSARWRPDAPDRIADVAMELDDLDLLPLSPYFSGFTGREILHGSASLDLRCEIDQGRLSVHDTLIVDGLRLGGRAEGYAGVELPLDIAIALLRDERGRIEIAIPVPDVQLESGTGPAAIFGRALAQYIGAVASEPFETIGEAVGWTRGDLGQVAFASGSAAITPTQETRLSALARALAQRPGLDLRVHPGFDPVADRDALAHQQVRLHIALATSAGPPGRATQEHLDLTDPKVIVVLDEFAGNRLDKQRLEAIAARFPDRQRAYYLAVFDALVANERVSGLALNSLARYRAQSVVDRLGGSGIDAGRLRIADEIEAVSSAYDAVAISLALEAGSGIAPKTRRRANPLR